MLNTKEGHAHRAAQRSQKLARPAKPVLAAGALILELDALAGLFEF